MSERISIGPGQFIFVTVVTAWESAGERDLKGPPRTITCMREAHHQDIVQQHWSILCDFDGTIALDDVVDELLVRFGLAGWRELEERWRAGHIGSRECMSAQVELLDVRQDEFDAYLDLVVIDAAFPAFVARAREFGMSIRVVSDGLDYAIQRILSRHGLGELPIVANQLLSAGTPGRWRLKSPFAVASCRSGTCKCRQVSATQDGRRQLSLLVGDGASDFCVAGKADLVFAKGRLIEYCRLERISHRPIAGFADALELLPILTDSGRANPRPRPAIQSLY